jgi:hypothetical protein
VAGEWIGVAGTALGAGIGGIVTVVSLIVKGRQDASADMRRLAHEERATLVTVEREDAQRLMERQWDVKRQDVELRRNLYAQLWEVAESILISGEGLGLATFASLSTNEIQFDEQKVSSNFNKKSDELERLTARVRFLAVESRVVDLANDVWREASRFRWMVGGFVIHRSDQDFRTNLDKNRQEHAECSMKLAQHLRDFSEACREDLGLTTSTDHIVKGLRSDV